MRVQCEELMVDVLEKRIWKLRELMSVFSTAEENKVSFPQCVLIPVYMENMENNKFCCGGLDAMESLGISSEGKFHGAAAKMEIRFKNHVGKHEIFRVNLTQMMLLAQQWL